MDKAGRYAFIAGFAIAVFAGLGFQATWVAWVLAALGVVLTGREWRRLWVYYALIVSMATTGSP